MQMPGVEFAEEMSDDEHNLSWGVLAILLLVICLIAWSIADGLQHSAMQKDADEAARCHSLGGTYSGNKCYIKGEEL